MIVDIFSWLDELDGDLCDGGVYSMGANLRSWGGLGLFCLCQAVSSAFDLPKQFSDVLFSCLTRSRLRLGNAN